MSKKPPPPPPPPKPNPVPPFPDKKIRPPAIIVPR